MVDVVILLHLLLLVAVTPCCAVAVADAIGFVAVAATGGKVFAVAAAISYLLLQAVCFLLLLSWMPF